MAIPGLFEPEITVIKKRIWLRRPNKYRILQVLVALCAGLSSLAPGMSMGFSAVALPELRPQFHKPGVTLPLLPTSNDYGVKINATESLSDLEFPKNGGKLSLSNEQLAWFMSITMATTPLGCLISGYLNDLIGRKNALLSIAFPGITGWTMLATVPEASSPGEAWHASSAVVAQMIMGRVLNGIAIGMASSPASVLACETTAPRLRGTVLCVNSLFITQGVLLAYFLGGVVSGWRVVAAFGAILTGMVALLATVLPESPVWLRSKGRHGDADWVCYWLGLRTTRPTARVGGLKEVRGGTGTFRQDSSDDINGVMESIRLLLEPQHLRPFLILAGLFLFQQAAGIFVVTFNAVEIVAAFGMKSTVVSSHMTAILIGMCTLIGLSLVCIFIDKLGRRPALIFSATAMSISMAVLAIYAQTVSPNSQMTQVKHYPFWTRLSNYSQPFHSPTTHGFGGDWYGPPAGNDTESSEILPASESPWHSWIPVAAMLTWAFSSGLGLLPLPWALPPELLPTKIRGIGFGILTAMAYTFAFVALRVFSSLVIPLGLAVCMYFMSISAAAGAVYAAALLPETRGMAIDGLEERGGQWKEIGSSVNVTDSNRAEDAIVECE